MNAGFLSIGRYKRGGKLLQIFVPPEKVTRILSRITRRGVAIRTICTSSIEARKLIKEIEERFY